MYLKDLVEAEPPEEAGRYGRVIKALHAQGKEPPGIYYLFSANPEAAGPLADFTQAVMRGPSDLSPGQRELIAALVSARNHCLFWTSAHAAVAAHLLEDRPLVDAVLEDVETAPISDAEKGLLRYVLKVNATPAAVSQADVDAAKALGWSDRALYDAATVCALFNFYNRWIDAAGVREMPEGFYEARLEAQGDMGYRM